MKDCTNCIFFWFGFVWLAKAPPLFSTLVIIPSTRLVIVKLSDEETIRKSVLRWSADRVTVLDRLGSTMQCHAAGPTFHANEDQSQGRIMDCHTSGGLHWRASDNHGRDGG